MIAQYVECGVAVGEGQLGRHGWRCAAETDRCCYPPPLPPHDPTRSAGGADLSLDSALARVRALHRESLGSVREADDTGVWLASGSVLSEVARMVEQLEGSTPALRVKPDKPRPRKLRRPVDVRSGGD
jgi:hypothetical protein